MKPMIAAFVATGLIAVIAVQALQQAGFSSAEQTSGSAVRLGE